MEWHFPGQTCAFTGHRPEKLPWGTRETDPRCIDLKKRIRDACEAVYTMGVRHFICGMAQGCDTYFCEELIALRKEGREFTIEAAIPCEEQSSRWTRQDRVRYYRLLEECDEKTVISPHYTPDCMARRNHYMVDNAAFLIACTGGAQGGAEATVRYARQQGLDIIRIDTQL